MKNKPIAKHASKPKKAHQRKGTETPMDRGARSDKPTPKGKGQQDWT
jgi:hypothetical protein